MSKYSKVNRRHPVASRRGPRRPVPLWPPRVRASARVASDGAMKLEEARGAVRWNQNRRGTRSPPRRPFPLRPPPPVFLRFLRRLCETRSKQREAERHSERDSQAEEGNYVGRRPDTCSLLERRLREETVTLGRFSVASLFPLVPRWQRATATAFSFLRTS